jgi:hypothetical protein
MLVLVIKRRLLGWPHRKMMSSILWWRLLLLALQKLLVGLLLLQIVHIRRKAVNKGSDVGIRKRGIRCGGARVLDWATRPISLPTRIRVWVKGGRSYI